MNRDSTPSLHSFAKAHNAAKDDSYLDFYSRELESYRESASNVLELGVQGGGSVKMWQDYFPNAMIYGADIDDCSNVAVGDRVRFFQGRQEDGEFLKTITNQVEGGQFDIIIDDAAHFGLYSKLTYEHLFEKHLKPGGVYIIEDWGTGYWDHWPDGSRYEAPAHEVENRDHREAKHIYRPDEATGLLPKMFYSHMFGMVGFIKQLVDEAHFGAVINASPRRQSRFESMTITEGIVFIRKKL